MLSVPKALYEEMVAHSREAYPHECCGFIIGSSSACRTAVEVRRARNTNAERAHDRYVIDPVDFNAADKMARSRKLDIIGFYHSHPDHPDSPSSFDRERGQAGYSYVIVSVRKGVDVSVKSWTFDDEDEPFMQEELEVL